VRDFVVEMLRAANPWRPGGADLRVRDVLADASARLVAAPAGDAEVKASLHQTIGESDLGLREARLARAELERALALRRTALGADSPAALESALGLAEVDAFEGKLDAAAREVRRVVAAVGSPPRDRELAMRAHGALGRILDAAGKIAEAEREHEAALALAEQAGDRAALAEQKNELALIAAGQGKFALAIERLEAGLAASRAIYGEEHPNIGVGLTNLAQFEWELGRLEHADRLCAEAVAMRRRLLGAESAEVAPALAGHAQLLVAMGDGARAEALAREGLALRGRTLPDEHAFVPILLHAFADARARQGQPEEAVAALEESLAIRRKNLPADSWQIGSSESRLGEALARVGRRAEAERLLRAGHERIVRALGADSPRAREARAARAGAGERVLNARPLRALTRRARRARRAAPAPRARASRAGARRARGRCRSRARSRA
jgi:tetratricopeptide (TPR) repeat protein